MTSSHRPNGAPWSNRSNGGAGGWFARRAAEYRQALRQVCTPADLDAIVRALLVQAKNGNLAAAKLLFRYAPAAAGRRGRNA